MPRRARRNASRAEEGRHVSVIHDYVRAHAYIVLKYYYCNTTTVKYPSQWYTKYDFGLRSIGALVHDDQNLT